MLLNRQTLQLSMTEIKIAIFKLTNCIKSIQWNNFLHFSSNYGYKFCNVLFCDICQNKELFICVISIDKSVMLL